ncbi:MAG TPA: hypothetical protein VHD36_02315 [Pirellulales bacterium]|nr:hypothetical protein [Pirellulales bacterium]
MIRWQILAAVALVCSTGGCQLKQLRRANEDLERENFQLEQRLDELTWQLEDAKAALQTCQNSLCATGTGSSSSPRSSSDAGPTSKPRRSSIFSSPSRQDAGPAAVDTETEAPRVELPDEETRPGARRPPRAREPVPRYTGPPIISPPDPQVPDGVLREAPRVEDAAQQRDPRDADAGRYAPISTRPNAPPPSEAPSSPEEVLPQPEARDSDAPPYAPMAAPGSDAARTGPEDGPRAQFASQTPRVAALAVNPKLTVWRKTTGDKPVDEGLRVVVEPRTAQGQIVPARGIMAIAVIDPAEEGAAARLARWDFTAEQTAEHFQGSESGGGLHFSLQWPHAAPARDDLLLFVRLTTDEGQQFVAEFALHPTSANTPAAWTEAVAEPRTPQANSSLANVAWKRAVTPLPPPPATADSTRSALPAALEAPPSTGDEAESKSAPPGPTWEPYR